jgi:hypothetical protein
MSGLGKRGRSALDPRRFDSVIRRLPEVTRRGLLAAVSTGLISLGPGRVTTAKKRKRRKRCRGAATKCGRSCCALAGPNPNCCPTPQGKVCTNLSTDPGNCGVCGNACAAGKVCAAGLCWDPCPEPSGCFLGQVRLCNGQNVCVSVDGVSVCAVGGNCFALTDCSSDPELCQVGSACAAICCGTATATCRTPA